MHGKMTISDKNPSGKNLTTHPKGLEGIELREIMRTRISYLGKTNERKRGKHYVLLKILRNILIFRIDMAAREINVNQNDVKN